MDAVAPIAPPDLVPLPANRAGVPLQGMRSRYTCGCYAKVVVGDLAAKTGQRANAIGQLRVQRPFSWGTTKAGAGSLLKQERAAMTEDPLSKTSKASDAATGGEVQRLEQQIGKFERTVNDRLDLKQANGGG